MKQRNMGWMIGLVTLAANLSPLCLLWLIWPRLLPAKSAATGFTPLAIDLLVALIFPLQHSVWTQPPVKRWLLGRFGEHFERPFYALASAAALILTVLLWQCSAWGVLPAHPGMIWPMRGLMILMLAAQAYCSTIVGPAHMIGVAHLRAYEAGEAVRPPEFREAGPYRWIRHPIAACQVLMMWVAGTMYADRLLLSVVWTIWIIGATRLEDNRLAREFDETYAAYRRRAGFLWPKFAKGAP